MKLKDLLLDIFRRQSLKKFSSTTPTGILPLADIKSATALLDAADLSLDTTRSAIQSFFQASGINVKLYYIDFHRMTKEEKLYVPHNTLANHELNWYGKPAGERVDFMKDSPDLFICLVDRDDFTIEYIAKCSKAKFKIGRRQLRGDTFDLIVNNPESKQYSSAEVFDAMAAVMQKIR